MKKIPRSVALNNPGNIRHSKIVWRGMAPDQPDKDFVHFLTPEDGFRALGINLHSYQIHDGCKTAHLIIARHAPASENPTDSYVKTVADALHVKPDAPVNVWAFPVMLPLCRTIAHVESGLPAPWPDSVIIEGLRMAGVPGVPPGQHVA